MGNVANARWQADANARMVDAAGWCNGWVGSRAEMSVGAVRVGPLSGQAATATRQWSTAGAQRRRQARRVEREERWGVGQWLVSRCAAGYGAVVVTGWVVSHPFRKQSGVSEDGGRGRAGRGGRSSRDD